MTKEQTQDYIRALIRERAGAVQYGRTETVEEIDTELAKVGHRAATPRQRATTMTAPPRSTPDGAATDDDEVPAGVRDLGGGWFLLRDGETKVRGREALAAALKN